MCIFIYKANKYKASTTATLSAAPSPWRPNPVDLNYSKLVSEMVAIVWLNVEQDRRELASMIDCIACSDVEIKSPQPMLDAEITNRCHFSAPSQRRPPSN